MTVLAVLAIVSSFSAPAAEPTITKLVFRFSAAPSSLSTVSSFPKTIYVAGARYARIEEPVDGQTRNLIIVNQPDIWVIDGKKERGSHMINPGPDFIVRNPILGPNAPQPLFGLEYGREMRFFAEVSTKTRIGINSPTFRDLGSKQINGISCDVQEVRSGDYRVLLNILRTKQTPHSLEIFLDGRQMIRLEYIEYQTDLPFEESLFKPPEGIPIAESPGQAE